MLSPSLSEPQAEVTNNDTTELCKGSTEMSQKDPRKARQPGYNTATDDEQTNDLIAPTATDPNGADEQEPELDDNPDDNMSVDHAIELLGMGKFQYRILVAAGLCFASDSMEILLLSFLGVVLQARWNLSDEETASITSSVFVGQAAGTLALGYMGDALGRRPAFALTAIIICVFGFATAFCNTLTALIVCRFFVGFGVGALSVPFDTFAEVLPSSHRGQNLLLIEYFWSFGTLLVSVLARLTLGRSNNGNEWRWLVGLCGIPCLISSIASILFVPESPRWLVSHGKEKEALRVLRMAAKLNGKNGMELFPPEITLYDQDQSHESSSFSDLLKPMWRKTTILLWCVWAGYTINVYGTILAVTKIFSNNEHYENSDKNGPQQQSDGTYSFDYNAILVSASSEVLGITLVLFTVDQVGRIPLQVASYVGGGLSVFVMCVFATQKNVLSKRGPLILASFLARMFFMGGSCTTWVSTCELLPTEIRTKGHSAANAIGRLSAALSPFLVTRNQPILLGGTAILVLSLLTALSSSRLPETAGKTMGTQQPSQFSPPWRFGYNVV